MTGNMDKVAVGFSTNEIRIWGIGDTVLMRPRCKPPPITFATDTASTSQQSEQNNDEM